MSKTPAPSAPAAAPTPAVTPVPAVAPAPAAPSALSGASTSSLTSTSSTQMFFDSDNGYWKAPIVVIVDEAHNFLGRQIGGDDSVAKLDAFELIAKEGRKYGLNICLTTQRPRDITEGVLSQMGALIVHRLTNDRDREIVERACGEIDRSASSFIPNLKPGEAAIIGADFPIPLTIQISPRTQSRSLTDRTIKVIGNKGE